MLDILLVALVIFALAVVMTLTGRGGGNFYVLTLVLAGLPMHEAATTGQFVLMATAGSAALVFRKGRTLSVRLALALGAVTAGAAFLGGMASSRFSGRELELVFSMLLALAGASMLLKAEEKKKEARSGWGLWNLQTDQGLFVIDLRLAAPLAAAAGFFSGMVGVSGGSFLVPLMVLACGVPMRTAVGTASAMVAATAAAGFAGHALQGSFRPEWALPVAGVAVLGGLIGGRLALASRPRFLKALFALTTLAAAVLMLVKAALSG